MSLREHLSELRRRFKISFLSFIIIFVSLLLIPADPYQFISQGYLAFEPIITFFISRVKLDLLPPGWKFIVVSINEPLEIYIVASILFAVIFNAPLFAYEIVKFISPGLNEREKKLVYPFVFSVGGLFAAGSLFGYVFLAKFLLLALGPFFEIAGVIPPTIDAANFYFIVFLTIAMTGIAFTVPVYVYTLIRFGIVKATTFTKNRIVVWAITYIICAVVTPDGGPLLDVLLFVPIISLLELAVFIGARSRAGIEKKEAKSGAGAPSGGISTPPGPSVPPSPAPLAAPITPATPSQPVSRSPAQPVTTTVACPYCSYPMVPGTVFCPNCGRSVE